MVTRTPVEAADAVKLSTALLDFILALLGVDARIKAGAGLLKAIAEVATKQSDSDSEGEERRATHTHATSPTVVPPREVNLRTVLDTLRIQAIEMEADDLLQILEGNVFVDDRWAICSVTAIYARSPATWVKRPEWVPLLLAHSKLRLTADESGCTIRIDVPGAKRPGRGKLGERLELTALSGALPETAVFGSPHAPDRLISLSVAWHPDSRPKLHAAGVRVSAGQPLPAFEVIVASPGEAQPHLSVMLLFRLPTQVSTA